jgi:hypothetical protein
MPFAMTVLITPVNVAFQCCFLGCLAEIYAAVNLLQLDLDSVCLGEDYLGDIVASYVSMIPLSTISQLGFFLVNPVILFCVFWWMFL